MEKKVHYLMLLLCLTLFPFRVYALDDIPLDNDDNTSDVVIVQQDNTQDEIQQDNLGNDSLDKKEDTIVDTNDTNTSDESIVDDGEKTNLEGNTNEVKTDEGNTNEVIPNEGNTNEENPVGGENTTTEPEEGSAEAGTEENVSTEIDHLAINGVATELIAGEEIVFGAEVEEGAPYHITREVWTDNNSSVSTDDSFNDELREQGFLLEEVVADMSYNYHFSIQLDEGYTLKRGENGEPTLPVFINGIEGIGYCFDRGDGTNTYDIFPTYDIMGIDTQATYVDSIQIINANTTATVDREPLFGAEIEDEHFKIASEVWYNYSYVYDENGYLTDIHLYAKNSDPAYQEEWAEDLTVFSKDKLYNYELIVVPDEGYHLRLQIDEYHAMVIPITFNGEQKDARVTLRYDDEGNFTHYNVLVLENVEPIEEEYSIIEHADMTIDKSEQTDLAIRSDGAFSLFQNVYVDGVLLDPEHYTNEDGETVVKFKNDYLQTLSVGVHNIAISFSDGKNAYTTLTITDVENEEEETTEEQTTASNLVTTSNYTPVVESVNQVNNILESSDEETKEKEVTTSSEEEEEEEKESSKLGLWIGLIALLLVAIAIPVTIYRRDEE